VTLAEYLADLLPDDFKGNETAAQVEGSNVWKEASHDWMRHNKVRRSGSSCRMPSGSSPVGPLFFPLFGPQCHDRHHPDSAALAPAPSLSPLTPHLTSVLTALLQLSAGQDERRQRSGDPLGAAPQETFRLADLDKSGGLNPAEHFAFMHPEDSDNEGLHAYMRRQDVSDRDRNNDGKCEPRPRRCHPCSVQAAVII